PIVSAGNSSIFAAGFHRFKLEGALNVATGTTLNLSGDIVVMGALSGGGGIALLGTGDTLEVADSNPGYTGQVTANSGGTILVSQNANDPLGAQSSHSLIFG